MLINRDVMKSFVPGCCEILCTSIAGSCDPLTITRDLEKGGFAIRTMRICDTFIIQYI